MNRCAMYARYSTDRQNPCSTEDQIRRSSEYAESHGWLVLPEHIYRDEALSGVGADREGFTRLMAAALSAPRPFDALLLDDTSRISRSLAEAARVFEHLNFAESESWHSVRESTANTNRRTFYLRYMGLLTLFT